MTDKTVVLKALKEDSLDLIRKLNNSLLTLEKSPEQKELWKEIMRSLHNLKGLAKVMGFEDIGTLTHQMEDVVKLASESKIPFSTQMIDVFLKGVDSIDYLLNAVIDNREVDFNLAEIQNKLNSISKGESVEIVKAESWTKEKIPAPMEIQDSVRIRIEKLDYLLNLSSEMVIDRICLNKELKDMETIQDLFYKEAQEWDGLYGEWQMYLRKRNEGKLGLIDKRLSESISRILKIKEQFDGLFLNHNQTISHHSLCINDLQQKILDTRMLPLSMLLSTFPRMVRDLSHQCKKEVEFIIEGGDIEVDKKIMEMLRDPLIHLLRNAIDHGIEEPEDRIKKGKASIGKIKLAIKYQGNQLRIESSDDGKGIEIDKIKQVAVKKGLYSEKDIASLEYEDLVNMIFKTGFTTSDTVGSISGRGVGMDIVQKNIKVLNGSINVESEKDIGTKVILKVPLSLATINILIVESGQQLFAIPSLAVEETLDLSVSEIHTIEGRPAISIREHIIPLAWLNIVLGLKGNKHNGRDNEILSVVVLGNEEKKIAFVVDKLVDEQEVVIKNISSKFQNIVHISGVTILGSGDMVLILDPFELMLKTREKEIQNIIREGIEIKSGGILVVEDQLTVRQLEKSILEAEGFVVYEARDGLDAIDKLNRKKIDLIITDIQMPRMNGFELTQKIKSDVKYKNIPVIVVSSLEGEEDKRKGLSAGADAYITKSDFNQQNLIEIIKRLIG